MVRKLILKLHLSIGLAAGLFIMILGLTGSIMAFEPEIEEALHPHLFNIPPQHGTPMPLDALAKVVKARYPGSEIVGYGFPDGLSKSTVIFLDSAPNVFVNQYTGEILGAASSGDFLDIIHQLHLRLLAGNVGKMVMSLAGVGMFLLVISGVILWWRQKQFSVRWNVTKFHMMFDLHQTTGISAAAFAFLLSSTGILIAYDSAVLPWLYKTTGTQPLRRSGQSTPREGAPKLGLEQAIALAESALPGAAPLMVGLPMDPKDSYNFRFHFPEDRTPGGRSWVSIDQYSGEILALQNSRTAPGPTRAQILNRAIHTGDVFGVPSKIIMSLCSLLVVVQGISGVSIWWMRDRKKQARPAVEGIA